MQDMLDLTDCALIEAEEQSNKEETSERNGSGKKGQLLSRTMRVHTLEGIVSRVNLNNRYVFSIDA
jgi:hypothetical protein